MTTIKTTRAAREIIAVADAAGLHPRTDSGDRGRNRVLIGGDHRSSLFGVIYLSARTGQILHAKLTHGNAGEEQRYDGAHRVRTVLTSWAAVTTAAHNSELRRRQQTTNDDTTPAGPAAPKEWQVCLDQPATDTEFLACCADLEQTLRSLAHQIRAWVEGLSRSNPHGVTVTTLAAVPARIEAAAGAVTRSAAAFREEFDDARQVASRGLTFTSTTDTNTTGSRHAPSTRPSPTADRIHDERRDDHDRQAQPIQTTGSHQHGRRA